MGDADEDSNYYFRVKKKLRKQYEKDKQPYVYIKTVFVDKIHYPLLKLGGCIKFSDLAGHVYYYSAFELHDPENFGSKNLEDWVGVLHKSRLDKSLVTIAYFKNSPYVKNIYKYHFQEL